MTLQANHNFDNQFENMSPQMIMKYKHVKAEH